MYRVYVYSLSILLTGLVLWPAFREPARDSFPLSNYPMFSYGRADPMLTMSHVLGVQADGSRAPLSPSISVGNIEVLQSLMTIHAAIKAGRKRQASFCEEVAIRVLGDSDLNDVVAVELVTSRFDCVAYFEGETEPKKRKVHHRCEVSR